MTIGLRIAERCETLGIKQRQLAERLNVSVQRLNNFIHDRRVPDAKTLALIAAALDTTSEYLLGVSQGEVASLENILSRVLELEGIDAGHAHTIARTVVAARQIAQAAPSNEADPRQTERFAAHAAWLSHSRQAPDK